MNRFLVLILAFGALPALADDHPVKITSDMATLTVAGGSAVIQRNQDTSATISGEFAQTSRACPPFCIQPMSPAPGVTTIGELELLEMLADPAAVVVDSRTIDWYARGTIPGATNISYLEISDRLDQLGCEIDFDGYDCEHAIPVALFCNGNWCGQSPTAIRNMISAGYPPEMIFYYRGGMQAWQMLGLTVAEAE